jgi:hypothetical protein
VYVLRDRLDRIQYACTDPNRIVRQANKLAIDTDLRIDFVKPVAGK